MAINAGLAMDCSLRDVDKLHFNVKPLVPNELKLMSEFDSVPNILAFMSESICKFVRVRTSEKRL